MNQSEYQVQDRDITNASTRDTGAMARPDDFNPISEGAAASLTSGLDDIADSQERVAAKEDMSWAQSRYAAAQVHWIQNINNYTDPDKAMADLQSYTQDMMKNAPTGRASDMLVAHMDSFAPRMARKAVANQAKAAVNANSENFVASANSMAQLATGQPLADPTQLASDGSLPQQSGPLQPMLGAAELRQDVYPQIDQQAAASKGIVPDDTLNQTVSSAKAQVGKGIIQAATLEDGPGAIAAQLTKDPDSVVPPDALPKDQLTGIINDLRTQDATNQGVAQANSEKARTAYTQAIDNGQSPDVATLTKFADDYANIMGGKGGKKADEVKIQVLESFKASQDAYNFKSSIMGLNPDQIQEKLIDFAQGKDENSEEYKKAAAVANGIISQDSALVKMQGVKDVSDFKGAVSSATTPDEVQAKLADFAKNHDETTLEYAKAQSAANAQLRDLTKQQTAAANTDLGALQNSAVGSNPDTVIQQVNSFADKYGNDSPAFNKAKAYTNKLLTDLSKSPGDYPLNDSNYRQSYGAAIGALQTAGSDPNAQAQATAQYQHVLQMGVAMQTSAGLPMAKVGVFPKDTAQNYVNQIQNAKNPQEAADVLHSIKNNTGDLYPNAVNDMVRNGLDAKYAVLGSYAGTPVENVAISALGNDKVNKETLKEAPDGTSSVTKFINNNVANAMADYRSSFGWNVQGQGQVNQIQGLVESVARQYMAQRGMDAPTAAKQASDDMIHQFFDYGKVNGKTMAVTKQNVPDGDTASVLTGAKALVPAIANGDALNPDIAAFYGKNAANLNQGDKDEYQQALTKYGYWVNSSDGKSMRLAVNTRDLASMGMSVPDQNGTGVTYPPAVGGKPIEVPLTSLQDYGRWKTSFYKPSGQMPLASEQYKKAQRTYPEPNYPVVP